MSKPPPAKPWRGFALARIKHPSKPLYYREGVGGPWVTTGYDTWSVEDWIRIFLPGYPDGRNWEFYGEIIEIWPER